MKINDFVLIKRDNRAGKIIDKHKSLNGKYIYIVEYRGSNYTDGYFEEELVLI